MLDLLIRGGQVVSPESTSTLDVGVKDGRVVLLAQPGAIEVEATRTIDATGQYVIPGGVDSHVHFGLSLTPIMTSQSSTLGSRAAIHGGTTTFIDFAYQKDSESLMGAIQAKHDQFAREKPSADYALHSIMAGQVSFEAIEEIKDAVVDGVMSFKMFTTFSGGSAAGGVFIDDGRIWGVMQEAERRGGIAVVHCEDDCLIGYHVRKLYREGRQHGSNIALARPNIVEEAAINRMLLLSKRSGCPLYVVHVSTKEGTELLAKAQSEGQHAYGEILHQYLVFSSDVYQRPNFQTYHNYPPVKSREDREALWQALITNRGGDTFASDDFTIPLAGKLAGDTVDALSGGNNGIEIRMPLLFSEGVMKDRISINQMVKTACTTPAKLFGIYPRKGIIAPGSDADIVLFDPKIHKVLRQEELHSDCDYSLWDGWEMNGYVSMTILRGQVLVENDQWVGPTGSGRFVPGAAVWL